jgi:hypothetical protein
MGKSKKRFATNALISLQKPGDRCERATSGDQRFKRFTGE